MFCVLIPFNSSLMEIKETYLLQPMFTTNTLSNLDKVPFKKKKITNLIGHLLSTQATVYNPFSKSPHKLDHWSDRLPSSSITLFMAQTVLCKHYLFCACHLSLHTIPIPPAPAVLPPAAATQKPERDILILRRKVLGF